MQAKWQQRKKETENNKLVVELLWKNKEGYY